MDTLERVILFDSNENYLADLNVEAFDPTEIEGLDGESRLLFDYPLEQSDVALITEGCFIAIPDLDGTDEEYLLFEIVNLSQSDIFLHAECNHDYYNLGKGDLVTWSTNADLPIVALEATLEKERYQIGTLQIFRQLQRDQKYVNPLESLRFIEKEWGGELKFRITITGSFVISRYVDLLERRGQFIGNQFEFGHNLQEFTHVIETSHIVTAAYGFGQADPETNESITFADTVWTIANGDPTNKPQGQIWVGDENARLLYGRPDGSGGKTHKFYNYKESQAETSEGLLWEAWRVVQLNNFPLVNVSGKVTDLGSIDPKFLHERARLGDDHFIIADVLGKPIEMKARIIKFTRRRKDPTQNEVEVGNFLPTASNGIVEIEKKVALVEAKAYEPPPTDTTSEIDGSRIRGIIEGINAEYHSSLGYVYQDENGILILNAPKDQNPTKAMQLSGGAFFLANEKNIDGSWNWRAFGDGDGFIADEIVTGTLDAFMVDVINLNADNINTGKLKAQFVEIGGSTTYEEGYNPTDKLETVFGTTPPTDKKVIWIDTTDPANVQWKVWNAALGEWILGPSGPRGPQGLEGPQGDQGIEGDSSFTHIAYATSSDGSQGFSVSDSTNKTYIGIYVDKIATDSTDPTKYNWTLIKGADGERGLQGPAGDDGLTPYLHIAWAMDAAGTGFSVSNSTDKTYIGTYTDYTELDSTDYTKYKWAKIQGPQGVIGPPGDDGQTLYTWVKYADDSSGNGMSESPTGKKYIGLAYNKTVQTESAIATDYTWSLIQGPQGAEGPPGDDGVTTYTWVKYADDAAGAGMNDSPTGKRYLGLAYNKTTSQESLIATDYTWSPLYDNVNVGGRNLYLDSYLKRVIPYPNSTLTRTSDLDAGSETNLIKIAPVVTTTLNMGFTQDTKDRGIRFETGKKYTLSFKARGNVTNFSYTYFMRSSTEGGNGTMGTNPVTLNTTTWTTITIYKDGPFDTSTGYILIGTTDVAAGKWFEVKEVKLEQGNVATDFTIAPEDLASDTDEKLEKVTAAYQTAIENSGTDITLSVSKTLYGDPDDPNNEGGLQGEMIAYTNSKITQTSDNINLKFTSIDGTLEDHEEKVAEVYSYFDFSADGLKIGKSDSPLQINISNEEMEFMDNGNVVAYVNGQKMYINTAEILQSIIVGNHKIEKYNTNVTLVKWVGE